MANNPAHFSQAHSGMRPLADDVVDALRDVVLVVDAQGVDLPIIMANGAARRCFLGDLDAISLIDNSLRSLLGPSAEPVIAAALGGLTSGKGAVNRVLPWRIAHGEIALSTEMKLLPSAHGRPLVMLRFSNPSAESMLEPGLLTAIENLPLDLLILDRDLTITYANAGAARTASTSVEALVGVSAMRVPPTSALRREALEAALRGEQLHEDAVAVAKIGAPARWFTVDVQPLTDHARIAGLAVLSLEVTDDRRNRRIAKGGDRRLVALTEHARDIICVASEEGRILYLSGGITNVLGYTPEERLTGSILDCVHPDEVSALESKYAELAAGTLNTFSKQVRFKHKEGQYRLLELHFVSALTNPLVRGVVINARDITERKQIEAQLAQREEIFRLASDMVDGVIFEWDVAQGVIHNSRGAKDLLGIEPEELRSPAAWEARIHPQDVDGFSRKVIAALADGTGWTADYRIRDAHGQYVSVLERAVIQRAPSGEAIRAIGCALDVSQVKRLTDLLADTQRVSNTGGWEYNYRTGKLEWTDEMYRIFGTTSERFNPTWAAMLAQLPPASQHRVTEAIAAATTCGGQFDVEIELLQLSGNRIWTRLLGHIETLAGRPLRAYGSLQNIQSQKLAQMALENSTKWLKLSMNMARLHGWRWTLARDTLEFAVADGQMVHLPRVFPGMTKLLRRVHVKDRVAVRRAIDQAFERREEVHLEFRLRGYDGGHRVCATIAQPLFDDADRPSGLVGVSQDVTLRHQSEVRLRRSEKLLRTTTANTADTLLLVDSDLLIRFINRGACGMSVDGLVGRDISLLLPPYARDNVIQKLRRVLASGEPATYEFETRTEVAGVEFFENRAVLVRDDESGACISITMRNITERKRMEQEILDVSSRERHAIGRDLHDGLGQELTGVSLMLRGLSNRMDGSFPQLHARVTEIIQMVDQSIETARSLARGLLPVTIGGGGLAGAMQVLADRCRDLYGLTMECDVSCANQMRLSEATANHIYRIAQEALTNVARHARASAVSLVLKAVGSQFELRVADDGVGVCDRSESSGMGLKIMRYRANMMGATFEVRPNDPRGTVILVIGQQTPVPGEVEFADAI